MLTREKTTFFDILKNLFFLMLFLQFLPSFFGSFKKQIEKSFSKKIIVGCLPVRGEIKNADWYLRQIKTFTDDTSIQALWIKIDSPGGYPAASQSMYRGLLEAKKKKPIFVEIQNLACSGAYYVALAGTSITALPSSLVGNIGSIMEIVHLKKCIEYYNVSVEYVKSGDYKDVGSKFTDLTPEQRAYLQATSDDIYQQFITDVAQERKLNIDTYKEWADGKAFTGNQAFEKQLIDTIGGPAEIVQQIQTALNSSAEVHLVFPEAPSLMTRLTGEDDQVPHENSFKAVAQNFLQTTMKLFINSMKSDQSISLH
jgi:protease-4